MGQSGGKMGLVAALSGGTCASPANVKSAGGDDPTTGGSSRGRGRRTRGTRGDDYNSAGDPVNSIGIILDSHFPYSGNKEAVTPEQCVRRPSPVASNTLVILTPVRPEAPPCFTSTETRAGERLRGGGADREAPGGDGPTLAAALRSSRYHFTLRVDYAFLALTESILAAQWCRTRLQQQQQQRNGSSGKRTAGGGGGGGVEDNGLSSEEPPQPPRRATLAATLTQDPSAAPVLCENHVLLTQSRRLQAALALARAYAPPAAPPASCACASYSQGRSTGVDYSLLLRPGVAAAPARREPAAVSLSGDDGSVAGVSKAAAAAAAGEDDDDDLSTVVYAEEEDEMLLPQPVHAVPVGEEYYKALRDAWRHAKPLPPPGGVNSPAAAAAASSAEAANGDAGRVPRRGAGATTTTNSNNNLNNNNSNSGRTTGSTGAAAAGSGSCRAGANAPNALSRDAREALRRHMGETTVSSVLDPPVPLDTMLGAIMVPAWREEGLYENLV